MIDEKDIRKAATLTHDPALDAVANFAARNAFAAGVEWFKKALWHDASVKPEDNAVILYQWLDDRDTMDVGIDGVFSDVEWAKFVAYISLLPTLPAKSYEKLNIYTNSNISFGRWG